MDNQQQLQSTHVSSGEYKPLNYKNTPSTPSENNKEDDSTGGETAPTNDQSRSTNEHHIGEGSFNSSSGSSSSTSSSAAVRLHPFHMEYRAASYQEDDIPNSTEDDEEEQRPQISESSRFRSGSHAGLVRRLSCGKSTLVLVSVVAVLALVIALFEGKIGSLPKAIQSSSTNINNNNDNAEATDGDDMNGVGGRLPGNASVLGTCRDPIFNLKSETYLEGLEHGAVASDHPLCSQMGTHILHDLGGNAVDAAVTTALCLGLASPASSGVGGGAFILIHSDAVKEDEIRDRLPPFLDARDPKEYYDGDTQSLNSKSGKITEVVDCRETAPNLAHRDMFLNATLSKYASTVGGLAVAVPGELKGLELAHARHGRLAWAEVIKPVVQLAREGVPINEYMATRIATYCRRVARVIQQPDPDSSTGSFENVDFMHPLRRFLTKDDNWDHPLEEGDMLRNPALGNLLERVMNEGTLRVFDNCGEVAQDLAREIQDAGGVITAEEIDDYQPTLRSPLIAEDVFGFAVAGVPPPSSGGAAVIGIARFLAAMSIPLATHADTLSQHWFVEACRHVFAIRMSLSDPNFNTDIVNDAVRDLIQGEYMKKLFLASSPDSVLESISGYGGEKWAQLEDVENGGGDGENGGGKRQLRRRRMARAFGYLDDHGTSHFSVIDKDGNAVAMTSTINTLFGSSVMSEKTGMILNNQMDDFATPGRSNAYGLVPAESNYIVAGKKPLSSMSPTLVFRVDTDPNHGGGDTEPARMLGPLILAVGGSGGSRIITSVAQVLLNFVVLGKPLFEAIVQARIHDQLITSEAALTAVEKRQLVTGDIIEVSQKTQDALKRRNHQLYESDFTGVVQAIGVDFETGTLQAVSDVRKGGEPDGY
ncbi:hypothetical protein ACA910_013366 [Epithemia clementina (nom. ined.)]